MSIRSGVLAVLACLAFAVMSLVPATSAGADPTLGFESSSVLASNAEGSADVQAGSHPSALTATFKLDTTTESGNLVSVGGDLKDVIAELPPGLEVDPLASTQCGAAEFATVNSSGEDGCPSSSAVGVIAVENAVSSTRVVSDFPIYDLTAPVGSTAQFGFNAAGVPVYLTAALRSGGDYGLTVTMAGIPQAAHVLGSAVTLWGVPAESVHDKERGDCVESHGACPAGVPAEPLLTLPGQCATPPTTSLRADSWQEPGQFTAVASDALAAGGLALTGCEALGFSPSFTAQMESPTADSPTGVKLDVQLPQSEDPSGLGEAELQEAALALPAGMRLNLARAGALVGCPLEGPEAIDLSSSEPSHCPEASKIGSVTVGAPLLAEALHGGVYLAQQGDLPGGGTNPFGSLLAVYIVAEGPGGALKLPAEVLANAETGQLTIHLGADPVIGQTFVPQLPLASLEMEFSGSQQSVFVTPSTCGAYATRASLTPWSGAAPVTLSDELHVTEGCADAFNPSFAANVANTQAKAYTSLAITLARQDGEQELKSVSSTLPEGMLAIVGSVTPCTEPQASLGTCSAASLIGEASVSVGVGSQALAIKGGAVYFTGPYGGGPFGLTVVMPALAGPLNLGPEGHPIVIRAALDVNELTGQITIASDATGPRSIPTMLEGIATQIRALNIVINRPQFTFNPSGCAAHSFTTAVASTEGAAASISTPFTPTGCGALPFGPKLTSSVIGSPSRLNGIGFHVTVVAGYPNESNAHYVKVELPKQLPSRLATLRKACLAKVFEANPASCPPGSTVGTATAETTVLPVPLVGPAYFVSYGNAKFPELVLVLQGDGVTIEAHGETNISIGGITSTTFAAVPDAPIPKFELLLPAGPYSALTSNGSLCANVLRTPTVITAENGLTVKEDPTVAVSGCKPTRKPTLKVLRHRFDGRAASITVSVPTAGKLLAGGEGFVSAAKKVGKAGIVTVKLVVSKRERRLLTGHRKRKLRATIKLRFVPTHGAKLAARVVIPLRR